MEELDCLWRVWQSQRKDLAGRKVLGEFEQRLRREWVIETGIIEDVYTLDRGVTRTLIEKGIDAALIPHGATNKDTVLVARVIQDHFEALAGMFDFVGGQRPLSTGYSTDPSGRVGLFVTDLYRPFSSVLSNTSPN